MDANIEIDVIRLYLNGSTIGTISRRTGLDIAQIDAVLKKNPTTADRLIRDIERHQAGEYVAAFTDSTPGRKKLPDSQRRKARQVRISDDEMAAMGNPSSTQIRERAMNYSALLDIFDTLEQAGAIRVPDEWLSYSLEDPSWAKMLDGERAKVHFLLRNPGIVEVIKRNCI